MMAGIEHARFPESEILERLKAGDKKAFAAIVDRYSAQTYRLARAITQNPQDAEEVVQDVFLTIFQKIGSFEGRSAFGTWLYRITVNAAMMKVRRREDRVEEDLERWLPVFDAEGRHLQPVEDWSANPEKALLQQERCEAVHQALAALPAEYRAVVALRDLQGLSGEEVAEILGLTVAAVKSRLHRGRLALRGKLAAYFGRKNDHL
ncbi:MAG: RNA polymerase sigma factor [Candidatus Methylomirabilales bacterium]